MTRVHAVVVLAVVAGASTVRGQPAPEPDTLPPTTLTAPPPAADPLSLQAFVRNGFVAETADKAFRFHFGGRLDYDNAWFTQDNNLLLGPQPGVRYQDGTDFRRARFRADGTVWQTIDFATEVNFAAIQDIPSNNDTVLVGAVGLSEFNLAFRELPFGNLRVGFLTGPYGLERYTSSNAWYYMERSSLFDAFLGPNDSQSGLQFFDTYLDQRLTVNATMSRVSKNNLANFGFEAQDGLYAAGARVTGLPVYEDDGRLLVHLGLDYFHQALADHQLSLGSRMPLRAGAGPTQVPRVVFTGDFTATDGADIVVAEAALVAGPFSLSAEAAAVRVANVFDSFDGLRFTGPRGDATYSAWYVEGGYFLTPGDHRGYDRETATWGRTVPAENAFLARDEDGHMGHGTGAVQLVARLSYLDLTGGSPVLTPTAGGARAGTQRDVTAGLNWYLNPQTFVMADYVWTHVNSVVPGASGNVHGFGVRVHFDF